MSTKHAPSSSLTDVQYQNLARVALSSIEAHIDRWLQDDVIDIDTSRTGGLLELSFPNGSKIIVNTQPPLHELWLAARGGGFHYRYDAGRWVDTKTGHELFAELSARASEQAGRALVFAPPAA